MFWSIELKHPCENHQHACYFHYFVIPYYQPSLVRKRPFSRWGVSHWPPVYWMAPVMISPFPARLVLVSHASELLQCSGLSVMKICTAVSHVTSWYCGTVRRSFTLRSMSCSWWWGRNIMGENSWIRFWNICRTAKFSIDMFNIQFGKCVMLFISACKICSVDVKPVTSGNAVSELSAKDKWYNLLKPRK